MNRLERTHRLYSSLEALGFTFDEAKTLRRIEMTLRRWFTHECNGNIVRNEKSGVPLWYRSNHTYLEANDPRAYTRIADREKGARARLASIMASKPELVAYVQGDPRGCALYIVKRADVRQDERLDAVYNRGLAVCS